MTAVDFSRRIPHKRISADVDSYYGLGTVTGYVPTRVEATEKSLKIAYEQMIANQKRETELGARLKSAADSARQSEVEFHDAVMAMKESIRGQFGPNSDEAQSVGYKKKSEYKRPRRRSA
ncbi:MAG: hypothetical protein WA949_05980 [Phormidesmis sp.]